MQPKSLTIKVGHNDIFCLALLLGTWRIDTEVQYELCKDDDELDGRSLQVLDHGHDVNHA